MESPPRKRKGRIFGLAGLTVLVLAAGVFVFGHSRRLPYAGPTALRP